MPDTKGEVDDLRLAAAGNEQAAARLYKQYSGKIFALAWNMLGERGAAEDVMQDVFIKFWQNLDDLRERDVPVTPWLLRVTKNRSIDLLRRKREVLSDALPEPADPASSALDTLQDRERDELVAKAIAELPDRQRLAITLTTTVGLSSVQAAETMEIGVRALESLTARARRSLKETLKSYLNDAVLDDPSGVA